MLHTKYKTLDGSSGFGDNIFALNTAKARKIEIRNKFEVRWIQR